MTNSKPSHVDVLPPSIASHPLAQAIAQYLNTWEDLDIFAALVYDIDRVTPTAFDSLIRQFSAQEFIRDDLSESQTRELLKQAIILHRIKGTPAAVRLLLRLHGIPDVVLTEWWQSHPPAQAHTFRVGFDGTTINPERPLDAPEFWDRARALVSAAKPARSSFEVAIAAPTEASPAIAAAQRPSTWMRLNAAIPSPVGHVGVATAQRTVALLELESRPIDPSRLPV